MKRFWVQREEDRPFQVDCCTKNVAPRDPLSKLSHISKVIQVLCLNVLFVVSTSCNYKFCLHCRSFIKTKVEQLKGILMCWCKKKKGDLSAVSLLILYNLDDNDDNK